MHIKGPKYNWSYDLTVFKKIGFKNVWVGTAIQKNETWFLGQWMKNGIFRQGGLGKRP